MSLKTAVPKKQRPSSSGVNCCVRCGMWFKMKYGKTTCDANRPKDLEEYGFEVPERLRETLPTSNIVPDVALTSTHHPEGELVDPTDWETELFSEIEPDKILSSTETLKSLLRETRTPFSNLVKDLISLTLNEKKGTIEGPFVLPRLIPPTT